MKFGIEGFTLPPREDQPLDRDRLNKLVSTILADGDEGALELGDAREYRQKQAAHGVALGPQVDALRGRDEADARGLELLDVGEEVRGR